VYQSVARLMGNSYRISVRKPKGTYLLYVGVYLSEEQSIDYDYLRTK
jgi:hypothetical protein